MKVQILKFKDGAYAVKRTNFLGFTYYADNTDFLKKGRLLYWWSFSYLQNAKVKTIEDARQIIQKLKYNVKIDYGEVIEEHEI